MADGESRALTDTPTLRALAAFALDANDSAVVVRLTRGTLELLDERAALAKVADLERLVERSLVPALKDHVHFARVAELREVAAAAGRRSP